MCSPLPVGMSAYAFSYILYWCEWERLPCRHAFSSAGWDVGMHSPIFCIGASEKAYHVDMHSPLLVGVSACLWAEELRCRVQMVGDFVLAISLSYPVEKTKCLRGMLMRNPRKKKIYRKAKIPRNWKKNTKFYFPPTCKHKLYNFSFLQLANIFSSTTAVDFGPCEQKLSSKWN